MGKVLAIIFLIAFVWYAGPLLKSGIWYSPTMYPDYWWGEDVYEYDDQVAKEGGGWFNFDPRKPATRGRTTASIIDSL